MAYAPNEQRVRRYLLVTGSLFGLLTAAHFWRIVVEPHLARDPWFVLTTVLSATLCAWAWSLLRRR